MTASVHPEQDGPEVHIASSPAQPGLGLYLHLPFCPSRCPYCDFFSQPWNQALAGPLLQAMLLHSGAHGAPGRGTEPGQPVPGGRHPGHVAGPVPGPAAGGHRREHRPALHGRGDPGGQSRRPEQRQAEAAPRPGRQPPEPGGPELRRPAAGRPGQAAQRGPDPGGGGGGPGRGLRQPEPGPDLRPARPDAPGPGQGPGGRPELSARAPVPVRTDPEPQHPLWPSLPKGKGASAQRGRRWPPWRSTPTASWNKAG